MPAPTVERIARRALVLASQYTRAQLEIVRGEKAKPVRIEMIEWMKRFNLLDELEEVERKCLEAPIGTLSDRQKIDADWRAAGAVVLAWALGLHPLPPHDRVVDLTALDMSLGMFEELGPAPVRSSLRGSEGFKVLTDQMFAIHWRLVEFSLQSKPMNFAAFARTASFGPLNIEGLPLSGGDLAIRGRPIAESAEDEWKTCLSIARERHQAAHWLNGDDSRYSVVRTDT